VSATVAPAAPARPRCAAIGRPARLLHVLPSFALGGAQRRTVDLANAFGSAHTHTILALDGDTSAGRHLAGTVRVAYRDVPIRPSSGIALDNLQALRGLLRAERPDLLLTYNFGALEAALANRLWPLCPHLHFEDGFGPDETGGRQLGRRVWLRRIALSGRSMVVVPSRTLERIALRVWRLGPERVHYIPNGIDPAHYRLADPDLPTPAWRRPEELVVGSVGGLRPEKNYARLLRAFAQLPRNGQPLRLVLVGDGPERPALERLAAGLGVADRVTFTGFLADPGPALRAFDVFALSSDTEQMPYSLIEAMTCGLPVVATDVGDVQSMLPLEARGWTVPATDEAAFAAKLSALLENAATRREIGGRNRVHAAAHFGLDAMVQHYTALFASLIGDGPSATRGHKAKHA
jgi:glycosyltransferase involved in cell wall biosynthesis